MVPAIPLKGNDTVVVGINDVWQLTMEQGSAQTASTPGQYEITLDQLLARAKENCGCHIVLMEPFLFCRDPYNEVLRALMPYVEIVRRLASRHGAVLVPLQARTDRLIRRIPPREVVCRHGSSVSLGPCLDRTAMAGSNRPVSQYRRSQFFFGAQIPVIARVRKRLTHES